MRGVLTWFCSFSLLLTPAWLVGVWWYSRRWQARIEGIGPTGEPERIRRALRTGSRTFLVLGIVTCLMILAVFREMHRLSYVGDPQSRGTVAQLGDRFIVTGPRFACVLAGRYRAGWWKDTETTDLGRWHGDVTMANEPRCCILLDTMPLFGAPPPPQEVVEYFGFDSVRAAVTPKWLHKDCHAFVARDAITKKNQWVLLSVGRRYAVCAYLEESTEGDLTSDFRDRVKLLRAW